MFLHALAISQVQASDLDGVWNGMCTVYGRQDADSITIKAEVDSILLLLTADK